MAMAKSDIIAPKRPKLSTRSEVKAFNIPHILNEILIYCEKTVLLQCRFVSQSWSKVSTLHMQKIEMFCFVNYTLQNNGKSLQELLMIFYNLRQLNISRKEFLCTHFVFVCYMPMACFDVNTKHKLIRNTILRNFLSTCGAHVQKLALYFYQLFDTNIATEKIFMDEVEKLLIVDLPNLTELTLCVGSEDEEPNITGSFPLSLTQFQINEIHSQYSVYNTGRNNNLKTVFFTGQVSAKVIEMVQVLAPNLNEICLPNHKIISLFESLDRINYLKRLEYFPFQVATYSLFDKFSQHCFKQSLKLRWLSFALEPIGPWSDEFSPQIQTRIVDILSLILQCSRDSLEKICWGGVVTSKGLAWPPLMPLVKIFKFNKQFTTFEKNIFPSKFSWCKTFPRLRQVHINNCVKFGNPQDLFKALNLEPIKTVTFALTHWNLNEASETELKDIFGTYFPNAKINVTDKQLFLPD